MTRAMADQAATDRPRPDTAGRRVRRGRMRRLRRAVRRHPVRTALIALLAVLLLGGAVLPAVAAVSLLQARDAVEQAQVAVEDGDLDRGRERLTAAEPRFRTARLALRNPLTWIAGLVPGLGQNLRAAGAVARAGELTTVAGAEALDAVLALPGGMAAFAPRDGVIPLEPIAAVAPALRRAADRLERAQAEVEAAPQLLLADPVANGIAELRSRLADVAPGVSSAAALAEQLPAFLGGDGPRRYFFGASNPAELRASGGFIGAFTVLEVDDGALRFGEFEPVQDMPAVPLRLLEPPNPDYAARYSRFGSAGLLHNINMTPDFPSAAVAIQRLFEHVRGEEVDGVILADPFAFAALLEVSGPVEVPGFTTVDADTVVDFVANEAYGQFASVEERKAVLGAVAAGALQGLLHGDGDPAEAARALAEAAGDGHLLLYASDPQVQEAFVTAGVDGAMPRTSGDYLGVVANNAANNKADFYLDRTVRYRVELGARGRGTGRLEVELHNETPTVGLPGHVIGPNAEDLNAGDNRMVLTVLCAECALTDFERDHRGDDPLEEVELGRNAYSVAVRMPSESTRRLSYELDLAAAWRAENHGDTGVYRLTLQQQSMIRPATVDVEVQLPAPMTVTGVGEGVEVVDADTVRYVGEVRGTTTVEVRFARPHRQRVTNAVRRFLGRELLRF